MNILNKAWILLAILVAAYGANELTENKNEPNGSVDNPIVGLPYEPSPSVPEVPVGRWVYIDDLVMDLNENIGGDTNSAQDLLAVLSLGLSKLNEKPAFIGVSTTQNGVNKDPTVKIVRASALNIPVYEGNSAYSAGGSELGQSIIDMNKQGKMTVIQGGAAGVLAWALMNGAHAHNITLYALMRNTWNAEGNNGMPDYQREAMADTAAYVANKLNGRVFEIVRPHYYSLIDNRDSLPERFRNTNEWIESNRSNDAWHVANTPFIMNNNNLYNTGRPNHTGRLRIADVLAMAEFTGIGWRNKGGIFSSIQHGLDIMQARIEAGAKNTLH